jgi:hypothetical protein
VRSERLRQAAALVDQAADLLAEEDAAIGGPRIRHHLVRGTALERRIAAAHMNLRSNARNLRELAEERP